MPQSVTSGDKWEYARVTRLKRSGFVFQSFILVPTPLGQVLPMGQIEYGSVLERCCF